MIDPYDEINQRARNYALFRVALTNAEFNTVLLSVFIMGFAVARLM